MIIRDGVALALVLGGIAALGVVVVATAVDGEWGRMVLIGLGLALCLAGRAVGRYDPEEAAARRAAQDVELRNRSASG